MKIYDSPKLQYLALSREWSVRLFCVVSVFMFTACGKTTNRVEATLAGGNVEVVVEKLYPIEAKPSEIINIEGKGFYAYQDLKARLTLADGITKDVPLTIADQRHASFVMPVGAGLGLKSVSIIQGESKDLVSFRIVANTDDNPLPILIDDQAEICSTKVYIDRNGDQKTGTKDCATGTVPDCTESGKSGCRTTPQLVSAEASLLVADNIKSGVTIAGISGVLTAPPSDCSSNGQQSCVATGAFFAGTACSAGGSKCFLPEYSVLSQPLKAISYNSIDQSKMLDSLTLAGITGAITSKGNWNLTLAFPGAGYYTGTSNAPTAATIASGTTITGIAGSGTLESHSNCSSDGATGCVAVATYPAALATGAASKVLSGQTLAGVTGNVTLPAAGKVLTGITYGVSGTGSSGTLTLPSASNVLSGSGTYGDPGAAVTPSLANKGSWDLTATFPGAGYYSGVSSTPAASSYTGTLFGTAGTGTLESHSNCATAGAQGCVATGTYFAGTVCGTDGSNCFLPAYSVPGLQTKKAIDFAAIDSSKMLDSLTLAGITGAITSKGNWNLTLAFPGAGYYTGTSNAPTAATIASGTTITGIAGSGTLESHSNCSSDGATGCVAVATYPAALATGAASKVLSGQTLAGVTGNVTLPAAGKVLTGITYGVSGTGSSGTLTLPSASNVLSGSGTYGDPGAAVTPSLANKGSWDLTATFPGAGYYSGVSSTPAASSYTGTLFGTAGTGTLESHSNCSSNGQQSCVASGTYFAGTVCGTDGSACYLPTYASGTQNKKAIDFSSIDSSKMLSTLTVSGVTGSIAAQSWNLQTSFPGSGYYSSVTNTPATSSYTGTLFGSPGTATIESHSNCTSDGVTGCVTTASYKSANMTNAVATNIKSGVTIAGIAGNYTGGGGSPACGFGGNASTSCTLSQFNLSTYPLYATFSGGGDPVVYGTTLNLAVNGSSTVTYNDVINYAFKANETRWFKIPFTGCSQVEDNLNFSATSAFTAKVYDRDLIYNTGTMWSASAKGSYPYQSASGVYYSDLTRPYLNGSTCDSVSYGGGTSYQYILITNGGSAQTIRVNFESVGY
ncbi:MAG: hypothetical protein WCL28_00715 [bacterium]